MHRQFFITALEIGRVGIDLAGVLQRDVLLRVLLVANTEVQAAIARTDLLAAGFHAQWDADDRQPVVLLSDHQHRFTLVTGLGRLGCRTEVDHGDAAGHRFVQQPGDVAVGVGVTGQAQKQQGGKKTWHGQILCKSVQ